MQNLPGCILQDVQRWVGPVSSSDLYMVNKAWRDSLMPQTVKLAFIEGITMRKETEYDIDMTWSVRIWWNKCSKKRLKGNKGLVGRHWADPMYKYIEVYEKQVILTCYKKIIVQRCKDIMSPIEYMEVDVEGPALCDKERKNFWWINMNQLSHRYEHLTTTWITYIDQPYYLKINSQFLFVADVKGGIHVYRRIKENKEEDKETLQSHTLLHLHQTIRCMAVNEVYICIGNANGIHLFAFNGFKLTTRKQYCSWGDDLAFNKREQLLYYSKETQQISLLQTSIWKKKKRSIL